MHFTTKLQKKKKNHPSNITKSKKANKKGTIAGHMDNFQAVMT
jgi:hypothetical protein